MMLKSIRCMTMANLDFLLPIILFCLIFSNTACAWTFPLPTSLSEIRFSPHTEYRCVDPVVLYLMNKACIIDFAALLFLLPLTAFSPVQKHRRKSTENRQQEKTCFTEMTNEETNKIKTQIEKTCHEQAIGAISVVLIHDLNNALSSVIGFAELSKMDLVHGVNVEKDLDEILNSSLRARTLANQILTCIRHNGVQAVPIEIAILVKEAMKLIMALFPVSIEVRFKPCATKAKILVNPAQFHHLLMILCSNVSHAIKDKAGVIELRLQDNELKERKVLQSFDPKPGRYLLLSIGGSGHGQPKVATERMFDPLQACACRENSFPGVSIVQRILKDMGGDISVCIESVEGMAFHVLFVEYEKELEEESNGALIDH